jgi:hypothetical protein
MSSDINVQSFSGKVNITSNLLVGSSDLFVDTTNNRVGLVTNNPDSGLHVNSNAYVNTDFRVGSDIVMNEVAGRITADSFVGNGSGLTSISSDSGSWVNGSSSNIHLAVSTDKVGIGTATPMTKLDIECNAAQPSIVFSDTSNSRYQTGIGSIHISGQGQRLDFYTGDSGANGTLLTNSPRMSITGTGNVGIGVTDPDEKLEINGNLKFSYTSQFSADGEKFIEFNQGGGGIKWGDGNSQIIDDGHLRICADDHIAFQLGSTSSSKGTERMGINSLGRNTLQGFEVKQQIIGYQIYRFGTAYNYNWSSSISGVWRDTEVINYTRKKSGTKIMVRFTPNASKAMSDASYRTQYFRVNTRLKITTANGAVTYSSTLDDWNRFDYGFSELENMRYDCFDAGTLSGSSANQNISFTFQIMGDAPSGHVGRYGLNLWANGSPNNGIEIYEIINE